VREELLTLAVVGGLVALSVLIKSDRLHRAIGRLVRRWGPPLVAWLNPPPEVDQLALDLANTMRRERLRADVHRVERLLATDEGMSGTRQLGNRLAYTWLVREFERLTQELSPMLALDDFGAGGSLDYAPSLTRSVASSTGVQHAPKVEILELGWRR
jgi:hypothetical protein